MSALYPIPRQTRQAILTATIGQTVFGPFDFPIFETSDVQVLVKAPAAETWTEISSEDFTVTPATTLPGLFSITLDTARSAGDLVWVKGARLHRRETNVTLGGAIKSAELEKELDRQSIVLQETRRDLDALLGGSVPNLALASAVLNNSEAPGGSVADALAGLDDRVTDTETDIDHLQADVGSLQGAIANLPTAAALAAALISSDAAFVRLAGFYTPGDGGGGLRIRKSTPGNGRIPSADGAYWEADLNNATLAAFGGKPGDSTFDSGPALAAMCAAANGRKIRIGAGTFYCSSGVVLDYSANTDPDAARIDIDGDGDSVSALLFTGTGTLFDIRGGSGAALEVNVSISNLSLLGNGQSGSTGINLTACAGYVQRNVRVRYFERGIDGIDCNSLNFYGGEIRWNKYGWRFQRNSISYPNAIKFDGVALGNNSEYGGLAVGASLFVFTGGSIAGNGIDGSETDRYGVKLIDCGTEGGVGLDATGVYLEANKGIADFWLVQTINRRITHNIRGCNLARVLASDHVASNIRVDATDGSPILVNIDQNAFVRLGDYVADVSRPYVDTSQCAGTTWRVVWGTGNDFSDAVELPAPGANFHFVPGGNTGTDDNRILRTDGTDGRKLQPSLAWIADDGTILTPGAGAFGGLSGGFLSAYTPLGYQAATDKIWVGSGSFTLPSGIAQFSQDHLGALRPWEFRASQFLLSGGGAVQFGFPGTEKGQLDLANGNVGGALISIRNIAATVAYNWNLPADAGTSGYPLLSGGGGSSAMTFGRLGLAAGGTNADLSATGGTSRFLKQASAGAPITVVQPSVADLSDTKTGTGNVVLATAPTIATPNITGDLTGGAQGLFTGNVKTDAAFYSKTKKVIEQNSNAATGFIYNNVYAGDGSTLVMLLGASSDPTSLYRNTTHGFQSIGGGATFATIDANSLTLSVECRHKVFTVATLPTGVAGSTVYASDLRVFNGAGTQEGAGAGTGGLVTKNASAWKIAGTNVTAVA